jgi:hypothetical protein
MTDPSRGAAPVFPPEYPHSYFQNANFRGAQEKRLPFLPLNDGDVTIFSSTELLKNRLLADFERCNVERSGLLLGEYVALEDGLFLIDRKGNPISINFPEAFLTSRRVFDAANTAAFWELRKSLLENWNSLPLIPRGAVFSHIYHNNYYHFTFEFMQNFRLLAAYDVSTVIMPSAILQHNFQRDMIGRALGDRRVIFPDRPVRVLDPVLTQSYQSYDGLRWIRRLMGIPAPSGARRFFIRRSPAKSRPGNNIAETPDFLDFLARWDFEAIDFGNGGLRIEQQIEKIHGAAVILAPHGAGLTNLCYLNPPLTVIELFSRHVLSASFIQIAVALGFKYYTFIADQVDEAGSIVPDIAKLDEIMQQTAGESRPTVARPSRPKLQKIA